MAQIAIGARVEGGDGNDYDTGTVIDATGFELSQPMAGSGNVLVAWDSGTRTWTPAADLRVILT